MCLPTVPLSSLSLPSISHSDDVHLFSSVSDYHKFPQSILDGICYYSLYQWASLNQFCPSILMEMTSKYACVHIFNTCRRDSNSWWFYGSRKMHVLWFYVMAKFLFSIKCCFIIIIILLVSFPSSSPSLSLSFLSLSSFFPFFLSSLPPFLSEETAVSW